MTKNSKLSNEGKWKRTIRWLRRCFPVPPGQVVVRRVPGAKIGRDQGETAVYNDGKFVVFINQSREFQNQIGILLHEWAHLLTWFEYHGEREDHTAEWGVIYARVYREHDRWNYGRKRKEEKNE